MAGFEPQFCISLQLTAYEQPKTICINLDPIMFMDANQKIDFPSKDCDALSRVFVTPERTRNKIITDRAEFVSLVKEAAAKMVVDLLNQQDTEMGYPKQ
jgi:hypothetical protein